MYVKKNLMFLFAVLALALPLMLVGTASAKYMADGGTPNGLGGWQKPSDGVCVAYIASDGTMSVIPGITTNRDCQAQLIPVTLVSAASGTLLSNGCTIAANNVNGFKYAAPGSSTCVKVDGSGNILSAISMVNKDRDAQMCIALGGQLANAVAGGVITTTTNTHANGTAAMCLAYGFQYAGQNAAGTPNAFSSITGGGGVAQSAGAGYCYTTMNMTSLYGTSSACPSSSTTATTSYDWSFSSSKCTYSLGIAGYANAALTKGDGSTLVAAGGFIDLSQFTTMGTCLWNGGSWSNWNPQPVSGATVSLGTTPNTSKIYVMNWNVDTPDSDNGCLHCHSTTVQTNGPVNRQKDSYLMTGHKNMLRKVVAGTPWAGPDGVVYTTDGTNTLNFTTGQAFLASSSTYTTLTYIYGDWMAALPTIEYPGVYYGCGNCHTAGYSDSVNVGVQALGSSGYVGAQPPAATIYSASVATGVHWDLEGITCSRCHNAAVPSVPVTTMATSSFSNTHALSGGMGALAAGPGRTNLCFGCHQSTSGITTPAQIPVGVSHGAAYGRDFNGHVLGNSFLNSPHARFTGTMAKNALGENDLVDPTTGKGNDNGTAAYYNSLFRGYTCFQSPSSSSEAQSKADGTKIASKEDCDALYACSLPGYSTQAACTSATPTAGVWASSWRADDGSTGDNVNGTCTTCHDVHNSLFVASEVGSAMKKDCQDCHDSSTTNGADYKALVPSAPQINGATIDHPMIAGTPFDTSKYDNACVVCHMASQAVINGNQTSMLAHLWRISTDPNYNTFPTQAQFYGGICTVHTGTVDAYGNLASDISSTLCANNSGSWTVVTKNRLANTAPETITSGSYTIGTTDTNAVWVDLDLACGQCHGGSLGGAATANGAPYFTKVQLAAFAPSIHQSAPTTTTAPIQIFTTGTYSTGSNCSSTNALTACFTDGTQNAPAGTALSVKWGDGSIDTSTVGQTLTHTYPRPGTYRIYELVPGAIGPNEFLISVPVKYTISGLVTSSTGTLLNNATVVLKLNGHTRAAMRTPTTGTNTGSFSFSNNVYGGTTGYTLVPYLRGYTFNPVTVPSLTMSTSITITAVSP